VFRGRELPSAETGGHLGADYVLSGGYRVAGGHVHLTAQLCETRSPRVCWAGALKGQVDAVLWGKGTLAERLIAEVAHAVIARELQRAQSQPLPSLQSHTLLMSAITLMHRLSPHDFELAARMLQAVADRAPRHPVPLSWLARWHVLRVHQGWSDDPQADSERARDLARRALHADAGCGVALVVDGLVQTTLLRQLDVAQERYDDALRINPSDSMAWLLKGTLHAFRGEGAPAVRATQRALRLSPLDPLRYYYESLAATAALSAGQYPRAISLAQRSLRANRRHASTFRALAIAQWLSGQAEPARETVRQLLRLEPNLTVRSYRARSPTSGYETGRVWSEALHAAGVPDH
jgi:adenylate cyclase